MFDFEKEIAKCGLTVEQFDQALFDISSKVKKELDIDWTEIKDKYGIELSHDTIRKNATGIFGSVFVMEYLKYKESQGRDNDIEDAKKRYKSETSLNKDGSFTSDKLLVISEEESKDRNFLLQAHGFDVKDWELVSARNNIWNVYSKQDGIKELYSSKIVVKPRTDISMQEIEEFYNDLVNNYIPYERKYEDKKQDGLMLEVPIFDLHIGKFSTQESGAGEYSTETARTNFNKVIDETIKRASGMNIEKIIFPIGSDFYNYDTESGTTTGGTAQDNDRKSQQLFKEGVLLLIDGITKLSEIAPVRAFYVPGNHDFMTSYHAVMALWCYFNRDEKVTVDTSFSPRYYVQHGRCLIGFAHGDKEKKRISGLMQVEAPEMWAETTYREFHLGHLHSEHTREENGIIIKNLSSVTGSDSWHHNSGYCGAVRKCTCFLWDKKSGLDSTFNVII